MLRRWAVRKQFVSGAYLSTCPRPSDLACAIAHAHHNSRKGEVRRVKYSAPHVVRPKKSIVCFRFLTDPIKT